MNTSIIIKTLTTVTLLIGIFPSISVNAEIFSATTIPDLIEPEDTYENSAPSLINMKIKTVITEGACDTDSYDGCTLQDVLDDVDASDDFKPEIKVHMTADNFPDDNLEINAELRQRGATSRVAPQKSFRVKLDSSDDLWSGERRIQLIKGFYDFTRIRNKLSYDLMADIPNLPSMRSQFISLEIENEGIKEDYGLYTQVEYFGKEYLERRGWDDDSGVYKAEYFIFQDDPAFELDADGEPVDEDAFEALLEIKRGKDHTELLNMIKAVNNPELDFKTEVFEKYFNQDNYLSWFASNILLGNADTNFHNFYLFNPKGGNKFYFAPWDYDLIGGNQETLDEREANVPRTHKSVANWWFVKIHKRFLQQPGNFELLQEAVLELKNKYFTRAKIQEKLDSYYDVIIPRISSTPDIDYTYIDGNSNSERVETYNRMYSNLVNLVDDSYQLFSEHLGDPMAYWLYGSYVDSDGLLTLTWSPSESLTGAQIKYDLEISTSSSFEPETIIKTALQLEEPRYKVRWTDPTGNYYYRVVARDVAAPEVNFQFPSSAYTTESGQRIRGVREFEATQSLVETKLRAIPDTASTDNATSITIDPLANDEGTGLVLEAPNTWSLKGGRVYLVNNKLTYTPNVNFVGEDKIWYTVNDADNDRSWSVITIDVSLGYVRADAIEDNIEVSLAGETIIDPLANDIGSGLVLLAPNTWSWKGGRVYLTDDKLLYTPKADFRGEDKIWYRIRDSRDRTTWSVINISVSVGYVRGQAVEDAIEVDSPGQVTIDPLANDIGSDLVLRAPNVWSLNGGNVILSDNKLLYTPKPGFSGVDKVWYTVIDERGYTSWTVIVINVTLDT